MKFPRLNPNQEVSDRFLVEVLARRAERHHRLAESSQNVPAVIMENDAVLLDQACGEWLARRGYPKLEHTLTELVFNQ